MNAPTETYVPRLSKSRFIAGRQCHLRLYNECFRPELATPVGEDTQAVFDTGHRVGELATERYPGGVLIESDHLHFDEAHEATTRAMECGAPAIFEAAVRHRDVKCRVDVLVRVPSETGEDAWDLVEVKSTTRCKEIHEWDVAVQTWVARGAGLTIRRAGVLTLNSKYIYRGGDYNLGALFRFHDRTLQAAALAPQVERGVAEMHAMLAQQEPPAIAPGPQCHRPYDCPFLEHCMRDVPRFRYPLSQLPALHVKKRALLEEQGIHEILDIPDDLSMSPLQERVVETLRTEKPYRGPGLRAALSEPVHPIHHLDFETFMSALPRYPNTRPYQALPFQWSSHEERADGEVVHHEFLAESDVDPRLACARSLLEALGTEGTIVTYSPYERRVIDELARALPRQRAALRALLPRLWDLHPVIKQHYYHPAFGGSFSLKAVLPALVPHLSYDGLEVGNGGAAQLAYLRLLESNDEDERARIKSALLDYCGQDTWGLVELRRALLAE